MNDCFQFLGTLGYEKTGKTRLKIKIFKIEKKNPNLPIYLGVRIQNVLPKQALSGLWKISRMVTTTKCFLKYIPA